MRTIKIIAANGTTKTIETAATTFGEIADSVEEFLGGSFRDFLLKELRTRVVFNDTQAILPEGNFTIAAAPLKSKGNIEYDDMDESELIEEIKEIQHRLVDLTNEFNRRNAEKIDQVLSGDITPMTERLENKEILRGIFGDDNVELS